MSNNGNGNDSNKGTSQPSQPAQQQPRQYLTRECKFHSETVKDVKEPDFVKRTRRAWIIGWLLWPMIIAFIADKDHNLVMFWNQTTWAAYIFIEVFTLPIILALLEGWMRGVECANNIHIIKRFHTSYWVELASSVLTSGYGYGSESHDPRDIQTNYYGYQTMYWLQTINRTLQADAMRRENEMAQLRSEVARLDSVNRAQEYRRRFEH